MIDPARARSTIPKMKIRVLMAGLLLAACTKGPSSATTRVEAKASDPEPPARIDLSDYDRSCNVDADCVVVHPQPCAKCGCADSPIAASEEPRFRKAIAPVTCPSEDPWPDVDCGACMPMEAYCEAQTCTARPAG